MLIVPALKWDVPNQLLRVEAILCAVQVTIATVRLKITDRNLSVESSCSLQTFYRVRVCPARKIYKIQHRITSLT